MFDKFWNVKEVSLFGEEWLRRRLVVDKIGEGIRNVDYVKF